MSLIVFDRVSVRYEGARTATLREVSFEVDEGELLLVVGRTGSGKSTLLGCLNGHVPHFTGGQLSGRVAVDGADTRHHRPRDLADVVGVVGQDPLAGFVTDTVSEELAYGLEQLGLPDQVMRRRVEETLDVMGIAHLRAQPLRDLSGGEQQRVAIGAVLAAGPRILVLDEPTSALDPTGAEDVLATITRLVHDLSVTVVMAEHRIERVIGAADRVLHLDADGAADLGDPAAVMATSTVTPPVVDLGTLAGWDPLPLSIRDARRVAAPLRRRLAELRRPPAPAEADAGSASPARPGPGVHARGIVVRHGSLRAVDGVNLDLDPGVVTALMGRNGAGKSSLLWALQGSGPRAAGTVRIGGDDPGLLPVDERRRVVGLVPQTAADLLYLDSVAAECAQADAESEAAPGTAREILDRLTPGVAEDTHPRDLSEGQKLALVLAIQLAADPAILLLDEPTRGLDYPAKRALAAMLGDLARDARHSVLVSTHDVEFVAQVADRVIVLADGQVVADGACEEVLVASPAYAPQVAKVMAPLPWLTVDQVRGALAASSGRS